MEFFSYNPVNSIKDDGLSKEDREIIKDAARNIARTYGIWCEDAEYAIYQALKSFGRRDLPPIIKAESEVKND